MELSQFENVVLEPGMTLEKNCLNTCSSPMDTINIMEASISIYPNPSNGLFTISFDGEVVKGLEIRLLNAIGKEVSHYKIRDVATFSFEITQSSGVYFLQFISDSADPIIYKILKY